VSEWTTAERDERSNHDHVARRIKRRQHATPTVRRPVAPALRSTLLLLLLWLLLLLLLLTLLMLSSMSSLLSLSASPVSCACGAAHPTSLNDERRRH
jgi:hypothetical protein